MSDIAVGEKRKAEREPVPTLLLQCPVCMDELGVTPGMVMCIITSCRPVVHYICAKCEPELRQRVCPTCRAPIGAVVPLPSQAVANDRLADDAHARAVKRLKDSEPAPVVSVRKAEPVPAPRQALPASVRPLPRPRPPPPISLQQYQAAQAALPPEDELRVLRLSFMLEKVRVVVNARVNRPLAQGDVIRITQKDMPRSACQDRQYTIRGEALTHILDSLNEQFPQYEFRGPRYHTTNGLRTGSTCYIAVEMHPRAPAAPPPPPLALAAPVNGLFAPAPPERGMFLELFAKLNDNAEAYLPTLKKLGRPDFIDLHDELVLVHSFDGFVNFMRTRGRHIANLLQIAKRVEISNRAFTHNEIVNFLEYLPRYIGAHTSPHNCQWRAWEMILDWMPWTIPGLAATHLAHMDDIDFELICEILKSKNEAALANWFKNNVDARIIYQVVQDISRHFSPDWDDCHIHDFMTAYEYYRESE